MEATQKETYLAENQMSTEPLLLPKAPVRAEGNELMNE
jgi:hypothetical protein